MRPRIRFEVVPISEAVRESADLDARPPTVMVVDDERVIADSLSAILRSKGLHVLTAYNGEKALELAKILRPDLLITDISMPEMTGVYLALTLLEQSPDCKILLFSGHATQADLRPAHEAGYDFTLLTKPVPPVEFLAHVASMLGVTIEIAPRRGIAVVRRDQPVHDETGLVVAD